MAHGTVYVSRGSEFVSYSILQYQPCFAPLALPVSTTSQTTSTWQGSFWSLHTSAWSTLISLFVYSLTLMKHSDSLTVHTNSWTWAMFLCVVYTLYVFYILQLRFVNQLFTINGYIDIDSFPTSQTYSQVKAAYSINRNSETRQLDRQQLISVYNN